MNVNQHIFYKLWEILGDICPVDESNPTDCPLSFLRKMEPNQRLAWFMAQETPEQILKLVVCHQHCEHRHSPIKAAAVLPPASVSIPCPLVPNPIRHILPFRLLKMFGH